MNETFQLNQQVRHIVWGLGTIRGMVNNNGKIRRIVQFEAAPAYALPRQSLSVPVSQTFACETRDLQSLGEQ